MRSGERHFTRRIVRKHAAQNGSTPHAGIETALSNRVAYLMTWGRMAYTIAIPYANDTSGSCTHATFWNRKANKTEQCMQPDLNTIALCSDQTAQP